MGLEQDIYALCQKLVETCAAKGLTVSTAESCTAGLVAARIADVSGASACLKGGAVTYCDEAKQALLGVSPSTLHSFTAVSRQTALEMATGSRQVYASDIAVSTTGYAGPGGGTEEDPAGTVYIGIASKHGHQAWRCSFAGDRQQVRLEAVRFALDQLLCESMELS